MTDKTRILGQYMTPSLVADLVLGFCIRDSADSILDPSCGDGVFLARASQFFRWIDPASRPAGALWGIELDIEAASQAQLAVPQANIISRDFFEMDPWSTIQFDAIVGNPPYTRSEWFSRLSSLDDHAQQLSIFTEADGQDVSNSSQRTRPAHPIQSDSIHSVLGRRAGLHAFFFTHGLSFLREGGRFGFVVPNSWLDVAYGEYLKRFLLEHYRILTIVESGVERWFRKARVNTCIIILEKSSDFHSRMSNQVNLVRLKRSLSDIVPFPPDEEKRLKGVQDLAGAIMEGAAKNGDYHSRIRQQSDLEPGEKWGIYLRSPRAYQKCLAETALHPLGAWAKVKRGYTTGANEFFYLDPESVEKWSLEKRFRKPLLKSLRRIRTRKVAVKDTDFEVLMISSNASIKDTAAEAYISWGEKQGFHLRSTCASRQPWYSLPAQQRAPVLLPKGIWERHFAALGAATLLVDQQVYQVHLSTDVHPSVAAALLNSAWFNLQLELNGRVNFGEGVLWLAQYELEKILLPDPRYLDDAEIDSLRSIMDELIKQPVSSPLAEPGDPAWNELNNLIFEIMGFSSSDRKTVMDSLGERLSSRLAKAKKL